MNESFVTEQTDASIEGKVAIVTGATSGVGLATASLLASAGARVILAGRRAVIGDAASADINAHGGISRFVRADVSRAPDASRLVQRTVAEFGRLDILVNNAAQAEVYGVEDCPVRVWDRLVQVNLRSVFLVSHYALSHLRRAGGGSIINVASVHAFASQRKMAPYAATKGAILALSRQMALDYADDQIRVNALVIGGVDTPMLRASYRAIGLDDDQVGLAAGPNGIGRVARPIEIAQIVMFLASDRSSFINGSPLIADGGLLARLTT